MCAFFFFSSRRRHTRSTRDWSSDVCSSDLTLRFDLYGLAFLENDSTGMAQQVAWSAGKLGVEDVLLAAQRSEERRVGKECRARGWQEHEKKKSKRMRETKSSTELYTSQTCM